MIYSNDVRKSLLEARKHLLAQRDPVANANIIKKIDRQIKKL